MSEFALSTALYVVSVCLVVVVVLVMFIRRRSDVSLDVKAFGVEVSFKANKPSKKDITDGSV